MKKINLLLHLLLPVIVFFVLCNPFDKTGILKFIFKPLIMVWVSTYFLLNLANREHPLVKPALFAFFFSWIGDIALLFTGTSFFLSGLGAFLIAHLFYFFLFQKTEDHTSTSQLRKKPWWIIPFIVYGSAMIWLLLPGTSDNIRPAMFPYAIMILAMAAAALNRFGRVPASSFLTVMAGAILFVASDSLIAINKFAIKIPNAGFWIMLTYISAQILIMSGLLMQVNGKK
jgi:uncharacterized membrane protein YhhN